MKKVLAGSFAAALLAVGVSAQTPPQNPPMQEAAKDAAKTLTVTGCLKAGDTPESFTLSDLKWKDDKAVGTSGATAPAAPPGTIGDKAAGSAAPSDPASARPSASAQTALNVRNVRMVSATCTP